jgi:hypothetical protein
VSAFDAAGNQGSKSPSIKVTIVGPDTTKPSTPGNLVGAIQPNGDVVLTWTPSIDNIGVVGYVVLRNGVVINTVTGPTATVPAPAPGDHFYQVRARDAAGNESANTPSTKVTIVGPDVTAPTTPSNLVGAVQPNGDVVLTWTPSTDNIGVTEYVVFRNSVEITRVPGVTATITAPGAGSHYYQVRARDAAGNESFKTPSTRIDI